MSDKAILQVGDNSYEFPLIKGTENEIAINVKTLRTASQGIITIDPGFKNTGSCESAITFLDGEKGILRHRGYAIEELTKKASFLEVAFLVIFGELPTKEQLEKFEIDIKYSDLFDLLPSERLWLHFQNRSLFYQKSPMTDSASALSYESPRLPTDGAKPASPRRSV